MLGATLPGGGGRSCPRQGRCPPASSPDPGLRRRPDLQHTDTVAGVLVPVAVRQTCHAALGHRRAPSLLPKVRSGQAAEGVAAPLTGRQRRRTVAGQVEGSPTARATACARPAAPPTPPRRPDGLKGGTVTTPAEQEELRMGRRAAHQASQPAVLNNGSVASPRRFPRPWLTVGLGVEATEPPGGAVPSPPRAGPGRPPGGRAPCLSGSHRAARLAPERPAPRRSRSLEDSPSRRAPLDEGQVVDVIVRVVR